MPSGSRPVVYISYRWIPSKDPDRPGRIADPRGRALADRLRDQGMDVRLDIYQRDSLHGFSPPPRDPGDPLEPWLAWSVRQVAEADAVLMLCTPEYAAADPGAWSAWARRDEPDRIAAAAPGLWWDWLAISQECDTRPGKFIPVGHGPYEPGLVPPFVRGATFQDLDDPGGMDALVRRIRGLWRARVPRRGVFVSYAHADDQAALDRLLEHLSGLRADGTEIWTDRDIAPGARWHETIQAQLALARVAVLMVSPAFLESTYIRTHELPAMLEAAEADGLTIFWIPVRASDYEQGPIARYQAAHPPARPLAALRPAARDRALADIGERLARALSAP